MSGEPGRALDVGAGSGRTNRASGALGSCVHRSGSAECTFEEAAFELVVVSFMHPQPDDREALFERVERALVPGGHVFTVGVALAEHGRRGSPDAERLYTPERLQLALRRFDLLRCEEHAYSSGRRNVTDVVAIGRRR